MGKFSPITNELLVERGFLYDHSLTRSCTTTTPYYVRVGDEAERADADIIVVTVCDEDGSMPHPTIGTTAITALLADAGSSAVLASGGIVNATTARAVRVIGAEGAFTD